MSHQRLIALRRLIQSFRTTALGDRQLSITFWFWNLHTYCTSAACNLRNMTPHLFVEFPKMFPYIPDFLRLSNPLKVLCSLIYRIMRINPGQQSIFKQAMQWLAQGLWMTTGTTQIQPSAVCITLSDPIISKWAARMEWVQTTAVLMLRQARSMCDSEHTVLVFNHLNSHCPIHDRMWCRAIRQLLMANSSHQKSTSCWMLSSLYMSITAKHWYSQVIHTFVSRAVTQHASFSCRHLDRRSSQSIQISCLGLNF